MKKYLIILVVILVASIGYGYYGKQDIVSVEKGIQGNRAYNHKDPVQLVKDFYDKGAWFQDFPVFAQKVDERDKEKTMPDGSIYGNNPAWCAQDTPSVRSYELLSQMGETAVVRARHVYGVSSEKIIDIDLEKITSDWQIVDIQCP